MAQKTHAQQECRREHKHYDVPHDAKIAAISRVKTDTGHPRETLFSGCEGGVFKPCQQRKGIRRTMPYRTAAPISTAVSSARKCFRSTFAQHKAIRSQETADCQQDKPEFCGGLKNFQERLKKHPGQTIVSIFRHFERDVEQCVVEALW